MRTTSDGYRDVVVADVMRMPHGPPAYRTGGAEPTDEHR